MGNLKWPITTTPNVACDCTAPAALLGPSVPFRGIHGVIDDQQALRRSPIVPEPPSLNRRSGIVQPGTTGLVLPSRMGAAVIAGGYHDPMPAGFLGDIKRGAKRAGKQALAKIAEAGASACDVLPDWVVAGMAKTQENPWRKIQRFMSFTIPGIVPLLVMPFTFPLTLFFYPILIFLETNRLAFALVANCFDVSRTMKTEACDIMSIIDFLSPATTTGRIARGVMQGAGAGELLGLYDEFAPKVKAVCGPMCAGNAPSIGALIALGEATASMADDADIVGSVQLSDDEMSDMEAVMTLALGENGPQAPPKSSSPGGRSRPPGRPARGKKDPANRAAARRRNAATTARRLAGQNIDKEVQIASQGLPVKLTPSVGAQEAAKSRRDAIDRGEQIIRGPKPSPIVPIVIGVVVVGGILAVSRRRA